MSAVRVLRRRGREPLVVRGREPYLDAAVTLLRESGCTVRKWRSSSSGNASLSSDDWEIEAPEPCGPVSYVTLAHEVGHQMLHRNGRTTPRWVEEWEAWEYALATFDRFRLPGAERARDEATTSMEYALDKAYRRCRSDAAREALVERALSVLPDWFHDRLVEKYG